MSWRCTKTPGGTGNTFDWSLALEAKRYGRIFLSGGLTPENVGEAVRQVLAGTRAGRSFEEAFADAVGMTPEAFTAEFRRYVLDGR